MSNKKTVTQTQSGTQSGTDTHAGTSDYHNTGSNKNTFDWLQMPDSADINNLRNTKETIDPSLDYSFSRGKADLRSSFQNPLGAYTTAATRDATQRSLEGDLEQNYGAQRRTAYNDIQNRSASRKAMLANLTAPRMVQSGSESTATGSASQSSQGSSTGNYTGTGTTVSNGGKMADLMNSFAAGAGQAARSAAP